MLPPFTTTVQNSYRYTTAHTRETICYFCLPLKSFLHRKPDLITLQSPRPRRYHRLKFPNNCHRSGEPFHSFQPVRILICVFPAGGLPQIARTCYSPLLPSLMKFINLVSRHLSILKMVGYSSKAQQRERQNYRNDTF